jgi:hypothetical protein
MPELVNIATWQAAVPAVAVFAYLDKLDVLLELIPQPGDLASEQMVRNGFANVTADLDHFAAVASTSPAWLQVLPHP